MRAGHEIIVDARELVPGDVLVVEAGDAIAADARLLDGAALQIAEAALTGESVPVDKSLVPLAPDTLLSRIGATWCTRARTSLQGGPAVWSSRLEWRPKLAESRRSLKEYKEQQTPLQRRIAQFGKYIIAAAALCSWSSMSSGSSAVSHWRKF